MPCTQDYLENTGLGESMVPPVDVLYQNGIQDALCSLSPDFDCRVGHLAAPDAGAKPRMKEAFAYERTARHRLIQPAAWH